MRWLDWTGRTWTTRKMQEITMKCKAVVLGLMLAIICSLIQMSCARRPYLARPAYQWKLSSYLTMLRGWHAIPPPGARKAVLSIECKYRKQLPKLLREGIAQAMGYDRDRIPLPVLKDRYQRGALVVLRLKEFEDLFGGIRGVSRIRACAIGVKGVSSLGRLTHKRLSASGEPCAMRWCSGRCRTR